MATWGCKARIAGLLVLTPDIVGGTVQDQDDLSALERNFGRGFQKFESRKLSALKGLTLRNLVPSTKEWLSKTSTSFAMLAMNKMIGTLLLKPGTGRHSRKEKVTLDDLFLLHSMDGGVSVDVPWHVAKFLCDKAKGSKRKSPIVGAHLIGKMYNGLGIGEMVVEIPEIVGDDDVGAGQAEIRGPSCQFYGEFGQWQTERERIQKPRGNFRDRLDS
ncbi:hypothetical protein Tco_0196578 [Tanacetum coccineum]